MQITLQYHICPFIFQMDSIAPNPLFCPHGLKRTVLPYQNPQRLVCMTSWMFWEFHSIYSNIPESIYLLECLHLTVQLPASSHTCMWQWVTFCLFLCLSLSILTWDSFMFSLLCRTVVKLRTGRIRMCIDTEATVGATKYLRQ